MVQNIHFCGSHRIIKNQGEKGDQNKEPGMPESCAGARPHPAVLLFRFRLPSPQVFLKLIVKNRLSQKEQGDPHVHEPDVHDDGKRQPGGYHLIDHIIQPVINTSAVIFPVTGKHIDMENDGKEGQCRPCCHKNK